MPRYSLSLGYFFTELPLDARFVSARQAGFAAVELFWPTESPEAVARASSEAGVQVVLFNLNEGDYRAGDRGFACRPERREWWRGELMRGLDLARALNCPSINVLTGVVDADTERAVYLDCIVENLRWAAPLAREAGVQLVIEPLNHLTHPNNLAQRTADVVEILDLADEAGLAIQYDIFHAQSSEGNIVGTLRTYIDRIGHIQIADVPSRSAPGTGELNFDYILAEIDSLGYDGHVGLEYMAPALPAGPFDWMKRAQHA